MTDAVALAVSTLRPGKMMVIFIICLLAGKPQEVATPG
jgi:hypothetical protein